MNDDEPGTRRLKIDLSLLDSAMEDGSWECSHYLDLETGDILMVTDETRGELGRIYEENETDKDDEDFDIEPILAASDIPDWQKDVLRQADRLEREFNTRYISVPHADSDEAYRDMEDFISSVQSRRRRAELMQAISRSHPFRRFKDVLADYPTEREEWFSFSDSRMRGRALEWLKDEGIEPI